MRHLRKFVFLLLLGTLWPSLFGATFLVRMGNLQFTPSEIDIDVGDSITWTNTDFGGLLHDTVGSDSGGNPVWQSPLFRKPGTFTFTFNVAPGEYSYFCTPHRIFGMIGAVRVHAVVPPSVNIASPSDQSTFLEGQTVNVSVSATDASGVTQVELLVDNTVAQTLTAGPFSFSLNLPTGAHKLVARATNVKNASADSAPVNISVLSPNVPPAVAITSPTNTASFQAPVNITIEASANHPLGIDHVEFFANGNSIGSDNTAPYSIVHSFTNGEPVTLTAQAFSKNALNAVSDGVTITIIEPIPSAPQITLVAPTNGASLTFASNIVLVAEAVDFDGFIANVKFFEMTNLLGTVTTPAISNRFELLTSLPEGVHTIVATATDNKGLITTSQPPATITFVLQPIITASNLVNVSTLRLGFFGSSGFPYVFEYSSDMVNWIPFKTNQLYRRILFFDVPIVTGEIRFYRATAGLASPLGMVAAGNQRNGSVAPPVPTL